MRRAERLASSDARDPANRVGARGLPAGQPDRRRSDLEVLAVIDWEMATLGDPLADLGLFLVYWDLAGQADNALSTAMGPAAGFPPGADLAAPVRRAAPAADLSDLALVRRASARSSWRSSSRACGSARPSIRCPATARWRG